jgi:hypothetical protein
MSNLTPTPRADKNGKVVTRHLKQRATSVSKALLSAVPMVGAKQLEKNQLSFGHVGRIEEAAIRNPLSRTMHKFNRDKSIRMMAQILFSSDLPFSSDQEIHRYSSEELFRKDVGYVLSAQEVEEALNLTMVLTRDEVPDALSAKDRVAIVEATLRPASDKNCGRRISRLNAQVEWLEAHPGEAGKVVTVLDIMGYEYLEADSPIGNLDALVAVADHAFLHDEEEYPQEMKRAYLLAAAQNPDQEDQIREYVLARNGFDEAGFHEYLNVATPLAGGAL